MSKRTNTSGPEATAAQTRWLWGAFAAALLIRTGLVLVIQHYKAPVLWENGVIAQYLLDGKGFAMDFAGPGVLTSWQAPGYPHLLYYAQSLLGDRPLTFLLISLLQVIATASMVFPIAWMTRRWFGPRAAPIAAWLCALLPMYTWYCTRMHQPAIVMSLYPWTVAAWFYAADRKHLPAALGAGALTGLGALFGPAMLAVFGVLSGSLVLRSLVVKDLRRAALIIAGGLVTLAAITPWTLRNYDLHGRVVPIKNSFPKEFWYGNGPQATGTPYLPGGTTPIPLPPIWRSMYGHATEIEVMDALHAETMRYVDADRPAFVLRTLNKIGWLWTAVPPHLLRATGDAEAIVYYLPHVAVWALLLSGLILADRLRRPLPWEYQLILGIVFTIYSITYGLTIVGNARFRGEIEFLWIPAVATVAIHLLDRWTARRGNPDHA